MESNEGFFRGSIGVSTQMGVRFLKTDVASERWCLGDNFPFGKNCF